MSQKLDKTYSVCYTKGMELTLPTLECKRCGHQWYPKRPVLPIRCAKCKTPYWSIQRSEKRETKSKI